MRRSDFRSAISHVKARSARIAYGSKAVLIKLKYHTSEAVKYYSNLTGIPLPRESVYLTDFSGQRSSYDPHLLLIRIDKSLLQKSKETVRQTVGHEIAHKIRHFLNRYDLNSYEEYHDVMIIEEACAEFSGTAFATSEKKSGDERLTQMARLLDSDRPLAGLKRGLNKESFNTNVFDWANIMIAAFEKSVKDESEHLRERFELTSPEEIKISQKDRISFLIEETYRESERQLYKKAGSPDMDIWKACTASSYMSAWGICLILAVAGDIEKTTGFLLTAKQDDIEDRIFGILSDNSKGIKASLKILEHGIRGSEQ